MTITTQPTPNPGIPANITRTSDALASAAKVKQTETMGKSEFLTLFTTQLQNQNPLDPVKNEAFVAQLAQFSQLEATTSMSSALSNLVSSMQGDRMMAGSALIGRQVAAPNVPVNMTGGAPVISVADLTNGADTIKVQYSDSTGKAVRTVTGGQQKPGPLTLTWDGTDDAGAAVPDGDYKITVTGTLAGQVISPAVSTQATVKSVRVDAISKDIYLDFGGGLSAPLSTVTQIN